MSWKVTEPATTFSVKVAVTAVAVGAESEPAAGDFAATAGAVVSTAVVAKTTSTQ